MFLTRAALTGVALVAVLLPSSVAAAATTPSATVTGTATCDAATSTWVVQWTIQNNVDQPATVVDTAVGPEWATFTGLQPGDSIGTHSGGPVTVTERMPDFGPADAPGYKIATRLGLSLSWGGEQHQAGWALSVGRCGPSILPTATFTSHCGGSVDVAVTDPANGVAVPVDVWGPKDFRQRVNLQPGGTATVTVPPSDSWSIGVAVWSNYVATGSFQWPAGCLPPGPSASDRLHDGEALLRGQSITSPDGRFSLVLQAQDANVVLYEYGKRPLWASGGQNPQTAWAIMSGGMFGVRDNRNNPVSWSTTPAGGNPGTLVVQNDGNVVIYRDSDHAVLWATNTCCHAPAPPQPAAGAHQVAAGQALALGGKITSPNGVYTLVLQDFDGNLVLYKNGTKALWAFGRRWDSYVKNQTDGNLVAYLSEGPAVWASNTAGKGAGTLVLQDDGNLVLYRNSDHGVIWATNTYGR